jgi:signal transduction histidine kinase
MSTTVMSSSTWRRPAQLPSGSVLFAWATVVAVPVLIAATLALHLHTGGTDLTSWWFGDVGLAAALVLPGFVVATRRPDNAIGWLLCLAALTCALSGAGREYLAHGFLGGFAPGSLWIGWFTDSLYFVSMSSLPVVLMLFPDGRPLSRPATRLLAVPAAAALLGTIGELFAADASVEVQGKVLNNPAGHVLPEHLPATLSSVAGLALVISVVLAVVVLVLRFRRSGAEVRQQTKWIVWSGGIAAIEVATELIPGNNVSQYFGPAAAALISGTICIAITRHKLFDIDLVLNRTLVYLLLSAVVVGLYIAVVAAAGAVLGEPVEIGPGLLATAVVALIFNPSRAHLQHGVDQLMYGERRNPYRVMTQLGRRLHDAGRTDELSVVVQTIAQALRLPYAAVADPEGTLLAACGDSSEAPTAWPLTYQGASMGQLLVSARRGRTGFDRAEKQLISDLARQVGAVVHAIRLSADLQASRTRLVSAKEEERRRLRRDLHDGLGPKLAALGLKIDAAHALADNRPDRSKQLLHEVNDDIRSTIDDIRHLVYGLRPPALDELGLVGAIREATMRFESTDATPTITIEAADPFPVLPAAVEVAAFGIATEAVTNTIRHARATRCLVQVDVSPEEAMMCLRVTDDGIGRRAGWRPGIGTASMRARAEELGGQLTIGCGPHDVGIEICARIPCQTSA